LQLEKHETAQTVSQKTGPLRHFDIAW